MKNNIKRYILFLTSALLLTFVTNAHAQDEQLPLPPEALNSPLYVPGEYREFRATVTIDERGQAYHTPAQEVGGVTTQGAYSSGIYRGEAVVWFSGNYAAGRGESYLSSSSTLTIDTCARVVDFHANNGGGQSTGYTCAYRTSANDRVRSSDLSTWSGCSVVYFNPSAPKIASNLTRHSFNGVEGFADASVNYGCSL